MEIKPIPIDLWWIRMERKYKGKSAMEMARWYIRLRARKQCN